MHRTERRVSMVAVGVTMLLFLGVIYAWSIFRVELSTIYTDFTAAQFSLTFSIAMVSFCIGNFMGGRIAGRFSVAFALRLCASMAFIGYMGVSFIGYFEGTSALLLMYICYGAICGFGSGVGNNVSVYAISSWFPKQLGLVSGLLLMGYALSSIFLGLLAEYLFSYISIFVVFRIYAVAIALIVFASSFFIDCPPDEVPSAVIENTGVCCAAPVNQTTLQVISSVSFWLFFIWNVMITSGGLLVFNSAANISLYYGSAAGLGLIVALANGIGRPVSGITLDKLGKAKGIFITNLLLIIGGVFLLLTSSTGSTFFMTIGLIAVGLCFGAGAPIATRYMYDRYGPKNYGKNFGLVVFCAIPASFIGPYVSGVLQDRSGGDYKSTFFMLLLIGIAALLINFAFIASLKREMRMIAKKAEETV